MRTDSKPNEGPIEIDAALLDAISGGIGASPTNLLTVSLAANTANILSRLIAISNQTVSALSGVPRSQLPLAFALPITL